MSSMAPSVESTSVFCVVCSATVTLVVIDGMRKLMPDGGSG
jgi:hypothetical protein